MLNNLLEHKEINGFKFLLHKHPHIYRGFFKDNNTQADPPWPSSINIVPTDLDNLSDKRKREFLLGRWCCASALDMAGYRGEFHLAPQTNRSPNWPNGWIGSITHTGFPPPTSKPLIVSSIITQNKYYAGLGIDFEYVFDDSSFGSVLPHILTDHEQILWKEQLLNHNNLLLTVIFSIKESCYKAFFPLINRLIDFTEIEVTSIDFINYKITISPSGLILSKLQNMIFETSFSVTDNFISTLCLLYPPLLDKKDLSGDNE